MCTVWLALSYTGGLCPGTKREGKTKALLWLSRTAVAARGVGSLRWVAALGCC